MQQLFPRSVHVTDPLTVYDRVDFPDPPPGRAYVFVNMVSSVDGRAQVEGRAAGLGSEVDQAMMQRLRALGDCVMNGLGTANVEQVYQPLTPELVAMRRARGQEDEPLWAVVTGSGKLREDSKLFTKPGRRAIAFVAESTPAEQRKRLQERLEVVVAGDERPEPCDVTRLLRQRFGCRWVLSEGGPTLNWSMLDQGALDELFMTFAPKVVAGGGKNVVEGDEFSKDALPRLDLVTLYEHEHELFFRYRVRR